MSKGHKRGPKPIVCSRTKCKKKWATELHIPLSAAKFRTRQDKNGVPMIIVPKVGEFTREEYLAFYEESWD